MGTAALQLTVTLTQTDSTTTSPLAPTGIDLPIATTLAGTLVVLGGVTLLRRGKRRDRRD